MIPRGTKKTTNIPVPTAIYYIILYYIIKKYDNKSKIYKNNIL